MNGAESTTAGPGLSDPLALPAELVTGEAVVLELRPASFGPRFLALFLDWIVLGALLTGVSWGTSLAVDSLDQAAAAAVVLSLSVLVLLGVPLAVETATRGRSLGKLALGLRVVRDDGGAIRFRHALVRQLLAVVEFWMTFGSLALIVSLSNRRGKRVGDLLAGTHVVRERSGGETPPPPVMPPHLAGWAGGCDLGRIPDRLAVAVRQFLGRADRLHPASRAALGTDLAARVARYVAPPPPPGTHPELFLAAALAERRERDLALLRRREDERARRESRRARVSGPSVP